MDQDRSLMRTGGMDGNATAPAPLRENSGIRMGCACLWA